MMGKGKILLAEDNRGAVRRIVEYIGKISGELEVISFAGAGGGATVCQGE